ncbi:hypothetical protein [Amycolatopsis sp. H20-H5]|uniref:hypothetical protein n=1 Tax=Amycolatopsis sp. H20-H5 TaxID=3046309 RepID=UPI002DB94DF6|nr:hypothetical protein [Amycolatopsis sp. H20-H5]MEC3975233.1 hypothetical protein [Amycolatopsis sp. H20-H5]
MANSRNPARPALEVGLILFLPAVIVFVTVSTALHGDFSAAGCGFWRTLKLSVFGADNQGFTCTTLPFAVDLPSMLLGITSEVAVVNYLLLTKKLRTLDVRLAGGASGLFDAEQLEKEPMRKHYQDIKKWLSVRIRWQLLLLVAVFVLGVGFYYWVAGNNHWFKATATNQGVAHPSEAIQLGFRSSWWAAWDRNPGMAVAWIVIGSVGTYFACCQAYIYYHLSRIFLAAPKSMVFRHVPARIDRDHGWRPVGRIIAIAYLSSISFIFSVIALIYILRDPDASTAVRIITNAILIFVALGGTVLNIVLVATLRFGVAKTFAKTVRLRGIKLNQEIEDLRDGGDPLQARVAVIEAEHLAGEKTYPIQGTAVRVVSLLSGIIPVSKLLNDLFHLAF